MTEFDGISQQSIEIGGPAGIRIHSPSPAFARPRSGQPEPGAALRLAARHPRLLAAGLVLVGIAAFVGPLILITALELPGWLLLGPALLTTLALAGAVAVARGSLGALQRAVDRPELERRMLELAARCGGRLTVALTAQHLTISLVEAEDALMALARAGHVDIDNDPESAAVLYIFRDLDAQLQPAPSPLGPHR